MDIKTEKSNNLLLNEQLNRCGNTHRGHGRPIECIEVCRKTNDGQHSSVRLEHARLVSSLLYGKAYDCFHGNGWHGMPNNSRRYFD